MDIKKIEWDELDDLLQVERIEDVNRYSSATLPSPMSSSMTDSQISNISTDDSSSYRTLSPEAETTSQSSSIYYSQMDSSSKTTTTTHESPATDDEETLKPCDFEDFKRQISQDFVNGANEMPSIQDGTLKFNQPIDPSRINDSLKLYQDNIMSKSMQSEDGLSMYSLSNSFCIPGQINSFNIQDTLNLLKNSSSSSSSDDKTLRDDGHKVFKKSSSLTTTTSCEGDIDNDGDSSSLEKGVVRSKSGPNYALNSFEMVDGEATVKPSGKSSTSINIKMDCYDEIKKDETAAMNGSSTSVPTTPYDDDDGTDVVVLRKKHKGSTAIKRRSGNRR